MDNWSINLCDYTVEHFILAFQMAFERNCPGNKVTFYALSNDDRHMVLIWGDNHKEGLIDLRDADDKIIPANLRSLPYPMGLEAAKDFAWHWLQNESFQGENFTWDDAQYKTGYRLHTDYWGHALNHHYGVIAITGEHRLIGK